MVKNVVLVHGGFVDEYGWSGVYQALKQQGFNVTVAQNPTVSLADDVLVVKRALAQQQRAGDSRRPFLWRRGHHRSGHRSARSPGWSISPPLRRTRANRWRR